MTPIATFDAIVVADLPGQAEDAVSRAGGTVRTSVPWDGAADAIGSENARVVLMLDTAGQASDRLADRLADVADLAASRDLPVVVRMDPAQIDVVAAALFDIGAQLLCEPTLAEWVFSLSVAGRSRKAGSLGEREDHQARALAEEIARLAGVLVQQLGADDVPAPQAGVAEPGRGFAARPIEAPVIAASEIRAVLRARRLRDVHLGAGLFEDPAWDMLLDLFASRLEKRAVSVSSLCIASAVAPTTALRWISRLAQRGLVARDPDPFDRRRAFVTLTGAALAGLNGYVAASRRAGLPLV